MTQEGKDLLLKDLCARLPYGVIVSYQVGKNTPVNRVLTGKALDELVCGSYADEWLKCSFKPYLRPMSSMTEEEWIKFYKWANCRIEKDAGEVGSKSRGFGEGYEYLGIDDMSDVLDWLNAHHFDYRGLIEKGLAIEAPEGMYKTE